MDRDIIKKFSELRRPIIPIYWSYPMLPSPLRRCYRRRRSSMQLEIAQRRTSTTSSTGSDSEPYPLLQAVWYYEISYPAVWCSAMWCGGVLVVFSSFMEGEMIGSSLESALSTYHPYAQCIQKGSGVANGLLLIVTSFCHYYAPPA